MSSLKAISTLHESQCDNSSTQSSDKLTRTETTNRISRSSTSRSVERTTIEVLIDSSSDTESISSIASAADNNNRSQSFSNRSSSSSYIESIHFGNKLENDIHQRYIDYINLSQEEKDLNKTDYTYAHSFAYSAFVPLKRQFAWLVPNMSRQSLTSLSHRSKQDGQNDTTAESAAIATSSTSKSSYSRKSQRSTTTSSSSYIMAGSPTLSSTASLNGKAISRSTTLHSHSKNTRTSQPEYSDDDEDYTLSEPKVNGRPRKPYSLADSQSLINRIRLPLALFALLLALIGGYYLLPDGSLNSIKSSIDNAYQSTSSVLFRPASVVEYRNADQFVAEIERLRSEVHDLRLKSQERGSLEQGSAKSVPAVELPDFDSILLRLDQIELKVSTCCNQKPPTVDTLAMQGNITNRLEEFMKHSLNASLTTLQSDIDRRFIAEMMDLQTKIREFAKKRMDEARKELNDDMKNEVQSMNMAKKPEATVPPELAFVEDLIRKAILKYDADKTGETDFALESAGAWILSTRCSETYQLNSASYKIFGVTMWKSNSSPRVVIQPGVIPGECWCFRGAEGRLGIHLSAHITPTAFTYEHIPRSLSRDGHIQSAPQSLSVYGLKTDNDLEPELLGEYMYDIDGEQMLQRFAVQNAQLAAHGFDKVELVVKSNHGHPEYTCLYRFRVHGQLSADNQATP